MNVLPNVLRAFALALAFLFVQGCATNGYITSSIATVVGLDVSENPKTQVPHVRFGYARTGMYYVPTGKTASGGSRRDDASGSGGSVKDTPTLVSEIFVHSKFMEGITISEKFAIGDAAVQSSAATTTFADNSAHAVAANGAVPLTPGGAIQVIKPRSRKVVADTDVPAPSDAVLRKKADKARGAVYAALEKLQEGRKTPAFFENVMQGAPAGFERSELGLTNYLDGEKDAEKITTVANRIKNAH